MAFQKEFERILMQLATCPDRPFVSRHIECLRMSMICAAFTLWHGGLVDSDRFANRVEAAPPTRSPFFGESLRRTPITVSVEDQTLDQVLIQLLRSVNLGAPGKRVRGDSESGRRWSLWLDRRVDPNQRVTMTAAGTPASKIIGDLVVPHGLVVYPLPGVLLIGRPGWVQGVLVNLPDPPRLPNGPRQPAAKSQPETLITVRWPTGTPAAAVLGLVLSSPADTPTSYDPNLHPAVDWLPHDVWRSGRFDSVDRSLAVALVLGQFDLKLAHGNSLGALLNQSEPRDPSGADLPDATTVAKPAALPVTVQPWREADAAKEFLQAYPSGDSALTIREFLNKQKDRVSVRASGEQLLVRTDAVNHLGVIEHLWKVPIKKQPAAKNVEEAAAVFDLKLVNKPVAVVLRQLAGAAEKKIRFAPGTELMQEQLISLDAVKRTLQELSVEVANQVGLKVDWNDNEVVIAKR